MSAVSGFDVQLPPVSVLMRHYSHMDMPKLTPEDVKRRVMSVCRNFEKINADEVSHVHVCREFSAVKCE